MESFLRPFFAIVIELDGARLREKDFTVEKARLASRGGSAARSFSSESITARLFGVSDRDLGSGKAGSEAAGVIRQAMALEYLYALCGLGLGFAAILGGIAMFIWTSIAHTVLPLGEAGIKEIPDEQTVLNSLRTNIGTGSGT